MADKHKLPPIDIQYKQLLEALVDRRIVPQKWLEQHKQLRDAVAVLYPELPLASDKLAKFRAKKPSHEDVNYFDCKFILECLTASDEGASKNFFGQYTSPVLKRWSALVRQYEKNNVFAAEAARIIAQNTAFEIPFLKKTMQQNEKQVVDNNRKVQDLKKNIIEYNRKLEASCASMGIPGNNFRDELKRLPSELPTIFASVASTVCKSDIARVIEYHEALQVYLRSCDPPVVVASTSEAPLKGKKAKPSKKQGAEESDSPRSAEDPFELVDSPYVFFTAIKELQEADDKIEDAAFDFEAEATEISWDISVDESGTAEAGEIDWGIETVTAQESEDTSVNMDAPVEIDWDITTTDASLETADNAEAEQHADLTVETPAMAATRVGLLSDSDFRTRILNDLLELRAFLRQREAELAGGDHVAFANQFQGSSEILEHQSVGMVQGFQTVVDGAISELTNKRLQQLVLIKNSDRYLDRHVASLEMLTKQTDKCTREISGLEDKNADLIDATAKLQPQIDEIVGTTKKLKRELEDALPALFKGYKVNIVGDVNSL